MAPPNVVLVLADDMGYSDLGCYGGEIRTPNLDALGRAGVRLTSFYNTARCSPSRASLLTGLHPHQAGIGVLTANDAPHGYLGSLNDRCVTIAEVLGGAGYRTGMAGKWHLTSHLAEPNETWPTRRGFERFFGTFSGAASYYQPGTLTRGETRSGHESDAADFFYTDAISAEAETYIRDWANRSDAPFFCYVAYTAPHWPLHAPNADIRAYDGVYDAGWDDLRARRVERLVREGILPPETAASERDPTQPAWADVSDQDWQARRMQAYAAQVERMDRGIGRVVDALRETGQWDNTLFCFLSDNGASPEHLPAPSDPAFRAPDPNGVPSVTRDGRPVRLGNAPDIEPGPEDTYASYGRAWANLSNTPFRYYKRWVHEGGIATPFIAHWPEGRLAEGGIVDLPLQLVDVLPTILDATGVDHPAERGGQPILAPEGRTMLPALRGHRPDPHPLYWEHTGNAAIRVDGWKLVREYPGDWELYDVVRDRCELDDQAAARPDVVAELSGQWEAWARRIGVRPWDEIVALYRSRGMTAEDAAVRVP